MNIKKWDIEDFGFHREDLPKDACGIPARITAVHRGRLEIVCSAGAGFARLKTGAYHSGGEPVPTVGDFVLLDWRADGENRILKTLPRRTYFSRLDPSSSGHGEQAVAANFDYVFILQALDRDFNLRRLERYLTLAWKSGGTPVILLTKADCVQDYTSELRAAQRLAPDTRACAVSAVTGKGLEELEEYLKPGRTIVFMGSSGAGKSSLINALAGVQVMAVGGVREKDGRGKHTTTRRQLVRLDSGVLVIDTPGMRELGMWDAREGLEQSFSDVEQYLGQCKFSDCRHQGEPGCAITGAIQSGALSNERWRAYCKLSASMPSAKVKGAASRERRQCGDGMKNQRGKTPDYRTAPCTESFTCQVCGALVTPDNAGSQHRNHCPQCLSSLHVDDRPGDRASLCKGTMDPIGVWVRKNGEWAVIHRCRLCGAFSSNRIAADDNPALLLSIAMKPLAMPPFPLWQLGEVEIDSLDGKPI